MKRGKSADQTGVVAEMLKAAGNIGTLWTNDVCNAVVKDDKIPEKYSKSSMVNVYKVKGDALICGSYICIKLLNHATKVLERVIGGTVRNIVKIDSMQFGFLAGKGTTEMDEKLHDNSFQMSKAMDENDLDLAIAVFQVGTHNDKEEEDRSDGVGTYREIRAAR